MAITVHSNPQDYTPSDNPVTWVFSSDQTAQPNFVYKCVIIIAGVSNSTHLVFPEVDEYAHFDISQILKSEVNTPLIEQTNVSDDAANYETIALQISESYGEPPVGGATVSDSGYYAFKGRLDDYDFIDYLESNYYWITDFPSTEQYKVGYNEELRLQVKNDGTAPTITITLKDVNGSTIASDTEVLDSNNRISQLNLKPSFLVANTTLTQANFDSAYTMELSTSDIGKGVRTFYVDNECELYDNRRFLFLSKIGSLEAFTFSKLSRQTTTGQGKNYTRQFGEWVGQDFQYNKSTGRNINYINEAQDSLLCNSDWIAEGVQNWLVKNLNESPMVFLQDGDDLRRVVVTSKGHTEKKRVNDMLFNEVLEVEYSNNRTSPLI